MSDAFGMLRLPDCKIMLCLQCVCVCVFVGIFESNFSLFCVFYSICFLVISV